MFIAMSLKILHVLSTAQCEILSISHRRKFPHYLFILKLGSRSPGLSYCAKSLGQKADGRVGLAGVVAEVVPWLTKEHGLMKGSRNPGKNLLQNEYAAELRR